VCLLQFQSSLILKVFHLQSYIVWGILGPIVLSNTIIWHDVSEEQVPTRKPSDGRREAELNLLTIRFCLGYCLNRSSTLKMETVLSIETPVKLFLKAHNMTWHAISEMAPGSGQMWRGNAEANISPDRAFTVGLEAAQWGSLVTWPYSSNYPKPHSSDSLGETKRKNQRLETTHSILRPQSTAFAKEMRRLKEFLKACS
jgi:hypothetical protein